MNPKNEAHRGRLRQAITYCQREWVHHLERQSEAMRQVAGFHYGRRGVGTSDSVLFPLLGLYVRIIGRLIQADAPRAHVSHWNPELDPDCFDLKLMLNDEFERIDLASSLNAVGTMSMYGMGIIKIGRIETGDVEEVGGVNHEVGGLFADPVLNEDFIFDIRAKRWSAVKFMGDLSRVPLEWAKENKNWDKAAREKLTVTNRINEIPMVGSYKQVRAQLLAQRGALALDEEYEDMVDLWNLFLPAEQLIVVCDRNVEHILSVEKWTGPKRGPYHILGYNWLPGNLVPLAPVSDLMDLHIAANTLGNKVGEDAANQKTNILVEGATAESDGNAAIKAPNRAVVTVGSVNNMKQVTWNGPDGQLWALAANMIDRFVYFGGNLDAIGGLSPQSATIGQDRLLLESASRQAQDMQLEMMSFTKRIMQDLAWYIKTDKTWRRKLVRPVDYAGMRIPFEASSQNIQGDISEYRIEIEPYNAAMKTPSQRMAMLRQILNETVLPLIPLMQEQGVGLNIEKLLKKISEYSDLAELADVLVYPNGEQERAAGEGQDDPPMKPPVTTRKYIRENRTTKTRSGQDQALTAGLMGVRQQPAEAAAAIN